MTNPPAETFKAGIILRAQAALGTRPATQTGYRVPPSCVVFTPRPLAQAIVSSLNDNDQATWLDPCVGNGAFVEAINAGGACRHRIRALDIDETPSLSDDKARTLRGQEFLSWSLSTRERFSRIVANPPFFSLSEATGLIRSSALSVRVPGGGNVPLGANCWFAFLCACVHLLRRGGSLGFILPAAWEYSDYASQLRTSLPAYFGKVQIHRCERPLFQEVREGCVVLLARDFTGIHKANAELGTSIRIVYKDPESLIHGLSEQLHAQSPRLTVDPSKKQRLVSKTVLRIGDSMQILLGGVTGDSRYFVLSDSERRKRSIPITACRPVISRAHHLSKGSIGLKGWQALRKSDERIWLFNPTRGLTQIKPVKRYLDLNHSKGGCNRRACKIRNRDPWFRTPMPTQIDGFMSGMSSWGPWVVFREMPKLAATNTLYIVKFEKRTSIDKKAAMAMWLLTSSCRKSLLKVGRKYAAGLLKFEPGDISNMPMISPTRTKGAYSAYKRAVKLLLRGESRESQKIANSWFK